MEMPVNSWWGPECLEENPKTAVLREPPTCVGFTARRPPQLGKGGATINNGPCASPFPQRNPEFPGGGATTNPSTEDPSLSPTFPGFSVPKGGGEHDQETLMKVTGASWLRCTGMTTEPPPSRLLTNSQKFLVW